MKDTMFGYEPKHRPFYFFQGEGDGEGG